MIARSVDGGGPTVARIFGKPRLGMSAPEVGGRDPSSAISLPFAMDRDWTSDSQSRRASAFAPCARKRTGRYRPVYAARLKSRRMANLLNHAIDRIAWRVASWWLGEIDYGET